MEPHHSLGRARRMKLPQYFSELVNLKYYLIIGAQDKPSFADAIRDTPATVVQALICFFSIWSVLGLWGYHTYLICRSVTTNEDVSFKSIRLFYLLKNE